MIDQVGLDAILRKDSIIMEDVKQVLEFVHQRIAAEDFMLLGLSQRRLLSNFDAFAQLAFMIQNRHRNEPLLAENIKPLLVECCYGLCSKSRRELQTD